jgi:hypothetical protein
VSPHPGRRPRTTAARLVPVLAGLLRATQVGPFTVYPPYGSDDPVELWKWMEAYEKKTGNVL